MPPIILPLEIPDRRSSLKPKTPRQFLVDGALHQLVTTEQLSEFIPRSEKTLRSWARQGIIPSYKLPAQGGPKEPILFDLFEVFAVLQRYKSS